MKKLVMIAVLSVTCAAAQAGGYSLTPTPPPPSTVTVHERHSNGTELLAVLILGGMAVCALTDCANSKPAPAPVGTTDGGVVPANANDRSTLYGVQIKEAR